MAKVWSSDESTPAAIVTFAGANSNEQPIIFATQRFNATYSDPGIFKTTYVPPIEQNKPQWLIKSVEVTLVRDWNISEAKLILTCDIPNGLVTDIPQLPNLTSYRGGNDPYLGREDEIRIYAGYVPSETYSIGMEDLCESPINPEAYLVGVTQGKTFKEKFRKVFDYKAEAKLVPIFWGFIDMVEVDASDKGIQIIISCRDRVRIMANTRILNLNPETVIKLDKNAQANLEKVKATQKSTPVATLDSSGSITSLTGDRAQLILTIANAINNRSFGNLTDSCWKEILTGLCFRGALKGEDDVINPKKVMLFDEALIDPSLWIQVAMLSIAEDKATPRIHIWTERPEFSTGVTNATIQVINKTPLELISHLALNDEIPIDFYASHVNGDFIFGPRVLDTSGFDDPERMYRTYYFLNYPREDRNGDLIEAPPSNSMIKSMRVLTSALATYNNFLVINAGTNSIDNSLAKNVRLSASITSWELANREPTPPCRTQIIADGSLASYTDPQQGAIITALSAARRFSRDENGIQLELIGDPTLYPGEAIRVYNTLLHDNNTVFTENPIKATQQADSIKESAKTLASQVAAIPTERILQPNSNVSKELNRILDPSATNGRVASNKEKLVLPIYKVRTVYHKIIGQGAKGFTTTIKATTDY